MGKATTQIQKAIIHAAGAVKQAAAQGKDAVAHAMQKSKGTATRAAKQVK